MIVVVPLKITETILTSSNVTETLLSEGIASKWTNTLTYSIGTKVLVINKVPAGAATHKIYKSTKNSNSNNDPTDRTTYVTDDGITKFWWEEISSTNRYKMFDEVVQDQTVFTDLIKVKITAGGYINALSLHNVEGDTIKVQVTKSSQGDEYNKTFSLTEVYGINNWYNYFFSPIVKTSDFILLDLPNIGGVVLDIEIANPGSSSKCGAMVLGQQSLVGESLVDSVFSIDSYSQKNTDSQGRITITKGPYAKRSKVNFLIDNSEFSRIQKLLTDVRDIPIVTIADVSKAGTINYGFIERFKHRITEAGTIGTVDIQGLT